MYTEERTVFLCNKGIATMRTCQSERCCNKFTGAKGLTTDLVLALPIATIVIIDIMMRCTTQRADGIFQKEFIIATLNRFDRFAILPLIVFEKELPVLFDKGFNDRKLINLKFLIFWRM